MDNNLKLLRKFISGENVDTKTIPFAEEGLTVLLRGSHIEKILTKYLYNEVSHDFLKHWAEFLLTREDIIYEEKNENIILEVLQLLSTEEDISEKLSESYIKGIFIAIS